MKRTNKLLPDVPTYSGAQFTWHAGSGCSNASDLKPGGRQITARLWDDAADWGFAIRSHVTGKTKVFSFVDMEQEDGEVICGVFESDDGVTVRVFND